MVRWEVRAGDGQVPGDGKVGGWTGGDLEEAEVGLPLVADHLAAGEAADRDDHPHSCRLHPHYPHCCELYAIP